MRERFAVCGMRYEGKKERAGHKELVGSWQFEVSAAFRLSADKDRVGKG